MVLIEIEYEGEYPGCQTVCSMLKKNKMLRRKLSKLQHGLTIDCIIEIRPFAVASVLKVESCGFTCKEQELLQPTWSLPGEADSLLVDRARAGEPERLQYLSR